MIGGSNDGKINENIFLGLHEGSAANAPNSGSGGGSGGALPSMSAALKMIEMKFKEETSISIKATKLSMDSKYYFNNKI